MMIVVTVVMVMIMIMTIMVIIRVTKQFDNDDMIPIETTGEWG